MKFFDEIAVTTNDPIEKQVFATVNEIVSKINEVKFIGVADLIQLANIAVLKIDKDKKDAVEKDMGVLKEAVQGLKQKTDIENDIHIRDGLVNLVKNRDRFQKAMENIIYQGNGDALDKKAMHDRLQAFLDAQELYQGYGALSPRDLTLAIQMIETAIETINNFLKVYATNIQANHAEQLKSLQNTMLTARVHLVACAMDLLQLNKKEYEQKRVVLSNINDISASTYGSFIVVPQMAESFMEISPTDKSEQDLAQHWITLLNDIIKESKPNPKLMQVPTMSQHLDETIPANPFLLDEENKKAEAISIRQYLSSYVLTHAGKHPIVLDMQKRGLLIEEYKLPTLWDKLGKIFSKVVAHTPDLHIWKGKISDSLNYYFMSYFPNYYKANDNQTGNIPAKPFATQVYHKLQDTMDIIWKTLGYQPAVENVIRRYHEKADPIAAKYSAEKHQPKDASPKPKHVTTVGEDNHTMVEERAIEDIDKQLKQKYPQATSIAQQIPVVSPLQRADNQQDLKNKKLQKQFKLAEKKYNKVFEDLALFDEQPHINILSRPEQKPEPSQDLITQLQQKTTALLLNVSKVAVKIKLERKSDSELKLKAKNIDAQMTPLLKLEDQRINFENLLKDTMSLCLSYSGKWIKPAPQRIQAINWLYEIMNTLNTSDATANERYDALVFALNKVAVEANRNHRSGCLGFFEITKSVLNEKIIEILDAYKVKNINPNALKDLDIASYEEFVGVNNRPAQRPVN